MKTIFQSLGQSNDLILFLLVFIGSLMSHWALVCMCDSCDTTASSRNTYLSMLEVRGKCLVPNAIFVGGTIDESLRPVVIGSIEIDELPPIVVVAAADDAVEGNTDDDDDCKGGACCCSSDKNVNFLVCSNCICVTKIL